MKIDRLLSIIIYLINNELVPASRLAKRYGVTVRTIQRDMETIELAGIPIQSIQGPNGGYGILETWKMDRQLVSPDDLYFIITALNGVGSALDDQKLDGTLEKMKTLLPKHGWDLFAERNEKLSIDFSTLGGDPRQQATFKIVKEAVEKETLLKFSYTSNKLESTYRTLEPMTIAFKWRSWYLFGYCLERQDYRFFRLSRIRSPQLLNRHFRRRSMSFEEFSKKSGPITGGVPIDMILKFTPQMRGIVEDHYKPEQCTETDDGSLIVKTRLPEDGWVYGFILSYGTHVEVLEPPQVRKAIADTALQVAQLYKDKC